MVALHRGEGVPLIRTFVRTYQRPDPSHVSMSWCLRKREQPEGGGVSPQNRRFHVDSLGLWVHPHGRVPTHQRHRDPLWSSANAVNSLGLILLRILIDGCIDAGDMWR